MSLTNRGSFERSVADCSMPPRLLSAGSSKRNATSSAASRWVLSLNCAAEPGSRRPGPRRA
jgi:hypothetical protein